jgi:hypothetical protein
VEVDIAQRLASYLREGGVYGALALVILFSVYTIRHLYSAVRKAEAEKFDLAIRLAPLASKLLEIIEKGAQAKARRGGNQSGFPTFSTPPPSNAPRGTHAPSAHDTLPNPGKVAP